MVLVDSSGHATYVERTMEGDATDPDEAEWGLSTYEFDIQDTGDCAGHVTESAKENLQNGSVEKSTKGADCSERTCEHKHHTTKRPLTNGTYSALEPAEKVAAQE